MEAPKHQRGVNSWGEKASRHPLPAGASQSKLLIEQQRENAERKCSLSRQVYKRLCWLSNVGAVCAAGPQAFKKNATFSVSLKRKIVKESRARWMMSASQR
eukprot:1161529-Pelagomonas_calceolata.AAC.10